MKTELDGCCEVLEFGVVDSTEPVPEEGNLKVLFKVWRDADNEKSIELFELSRWEAECFLQDIYFFVGGVCGVEFISVRGLTIEVDADYVESLYWDLHDWLDVFDNAIASEARQQMMAMAAAREGR